MTAAPVQPRLVQLDRAEFTARLDEAIHVYVTAMGYPAGTARQRRSLWLEHAYRPGWRSVAWLGGADRVIGVSYGYWGGPGQWWFEEVRRGLRALRGSGTDGEDWLAGYFELTELHVHPDAQARGLGEGLLQALLRGTGRDRVLLSTPEHAPGPPGRAWRLYRRYGFRDVLREHQFTGDPRPFAVLGRDLPLPRPGDLPPHRGR